MDDETRRALAGAPHPNRLSPSRLAAAARAASPTSPCSRRSTNSASRRRRSPGRRSARSSAPPTRPAWLRRDIRAFALGALRNRGEVMGKFLRARVGRFSDLVLSGRGNPVLLDGEVCLDLFWPDPVPDFFEAAIPLLVVATDFHDRRELFSSGARWRRRGRVDGDPRADSPVEYAGRFLIDGGAVNPLPYDLLFDHADIVVGVDVTFGGRRASRAVLRHSSRCSAPRRSCRARSPRRS